jgi:hypothetical protein
MVRVFRVIRGSMSAVSAATAIKTAAVMPATVESTAMMMSARTGIVMVMMRLVCAGIVATAPKPEAAAYGRRTAFAPRAVQEKSQQCYRHTKK